MESHQKNWVILFYFKEYRHRTLITFPTLPNIRRFKPCIFFVLLNKHHNFSLFLKIGNIWSQSSGLNSETINSQWLFWLTASTELVVCRTVFYVYFWILLQELCLHFKHFNKNELLTWVKPHCRWIKFPNVFPDTLLSRQPVV